MVSKGWRATVSSFGSGFKGLRSLPGPTGTCWWPVMGFGLGSDRLLEIFFEVNAICFYSFHYSVRMSLVYVRGKVYIFAW